MPSDRSSVLIPLALVGGILAICLLGSLIWLLCFYYRSEKSPPFHPTKDNSLTLPPKMTSWPTWRTPPPTDASSRSEYAGSERSFSPSPGRRTSPAPKGAPSGLRHEMEMREMGGSGKRGREADSDDDDRSVEKYQVQLHW